jgi:GAF domain-containing protein
MIAGMSELRSILDELLAATHASRVTLRRDDPGEYAFPVVEESLSPGIRSLRGERTVDIRTQPVTRELMAGRQVVQDDCRAAFDDPAFHAMLETYGGLVAQIVTPVVVGEKLEAIVSVHDLGTPQAWTEEEIAAARQAANRVAELL